MRNWAFAISLVLGGFLAGAGLDAAGEDVESAGEVPTVGSAVIVCKGMIDDGLFESIKRRTTAALDSGADYLIYEISTYGGLVKSADDISKYFILDVGKRARTVAYVTTEAISAGAMISVSCQDIIMLESTTIGACAPVVLGGKLEGVEREKTESFIRAAFVRAAEANGYPSALLKAMVSMQIEVHRVKNIESGRYEYFESDQLPDDPNKYDLDNAKVVVKEGELLTLTADQAVEHGVARAKVEDLRGALDFLAERDGVRFAGEPEVLRTNWSEEMVRWVNSPAVMAVLVMLALLGVYIEFSTPGIGLPGLVAAVCFATIIGSKYLVGLANWVEVLLFVVGVLLLLIEIFVLPGFGIAGFLGIALILAGLFGMLIGNAPDRLPWPQTSFEWEVFAQGVIGLALGFVGFAISASLLTKYLPRIRFLSGLILVPVAAKASSQAHVSMTRPADSVETGVSIGAVGEVCRKLRPAGKVRFGDSIVDVVAEGQFLNKGTKVQITEIHGNRVVVRALSEES